MRFQTEERVLRVKLGEVEKMQEFQRGDEYFSIFIFLLLSIIVTDATFIVQFSLGNIFLKVLVRVTVKYSSYQECQKAWLDVSRSYALLYPIEFSSHLGFLINFLCSFERFSSRCKCSSLDIWRAIIKFDYRNQICLKTFLSNIQLSIKQSFVISRRLQKSS